MQGDPRFIERVVDNVISNAAKHTPAHAHVSVTACAARGEARVAVSDDGPGIPPEKQGRVFEAYYTTKEKGTGLGLATVKHNVELYGGRVLLESELGKGARFVLLFPAKTLLKLADAT